MSKMVFIALGTNIGERSANLLEASARMQPAVRLLARSPIYETPPWGYLDQPNFLNQVIQGETSLSPQELLGHLKKIETEMGRLKLIQNGPRLIDLDILFYDDLVLESDHLVLPHPRMAGRGFVLMPLADLVPELVHPVSGKTIRTMLAEADCSGITLYSGSS